MDLTLPLEFEEIDLIQACIAKERWAQQKLYEDHYTKMMGICLRYAANEEDALDILHEGYIKVFKYITKYQPGTSLIAWIRRIMVNTAIDYYRKVIRRRTEDIDFVFDLGNDEPDAISRCSEQEILAAVQRLTPTYRAIFNLYVVEGYSHKEIAAELNITESTSRSNLVKARLKLQSVLSGKLMGYED